MIDNERSSFRFSPVHAESFSSEEDRKKFIEKMEKITGVKWECVEVEQKVLLFQSALPEEKTESQNESPA